MGKAVQGCDSAVERKTFVIGRIVNDSMFIWYIEMGWYNVMTLRKGHELQLFCFEWVLCLALGGPVWSSCTVNTLRFTLFPVSNTRFTWPAQGRACFNPRAVFVQVNFITQAASLRRYNGIVKRWHKYMLLLILADEIIRKIDMHHSLKCLWFLPVK